jgi:uncharacterized membrane protein
MAKTIVALYDHFDSAQAVLEDLLESGFSRENVSLLAGDATGEYARRYTGETQSEDVTAGEGAGFGAVVGGLIGLGVSLIPGIGPVIGAGPLAVALTAGIGAAAGAITGGITAALIDMGVDEEDADYYAEGLRRGGTLVTATVDEAWVDRVEEIMNRHQPVDIDHRAAYWRDTGWTDFNAEGTPYGADEMGREQEAHRDLSTRRSATTGLGSTSPGDYYTMEDRRRAYGPTETDYDSVQEMEEDRQAAESDGGSGPARRSRIYDAERR